MLVILLLVVAGIGYYIYFRQSRKVIYELANVLPDIKGALPVLGHAHWFTGNSEDIVKTIKEICKYVEDAGGLGKIWLGGEMFLVVLKPEDVQVVLENCLAKGSMYKFLRTWLGNGLFVAPVNLWKSHRRLLLPMFSSRIVEEYIDIFGEQSQVLVEMLRERGDGAEFDVYKYITSCTLDIVFETAMGERMDVQHTPETPYLRARSTVMQIINLRFFKSWLHPDCLFNLSSYAKTQKENIDLTHAFTDNVVRNKKLSVQNKHEENKDSDGPRRKVFLDLLIDKNNMFTDEELREHIDSVTVAGNDTTALVISYTLVLLGQHQDAQEKVYQELKSIFGDSKRTPTKDDLTKMEYLERVLKEAMRLYSPVPLMMRVTDKTIKLSGYDIPAGIDCIVSPFMMHRSKAVWGPDAEEFDPDRFLPENNAKRHPCAYMPFSHGTRNCIGRHFGMMIMKSIVSTVLRSYRVTSRGCDRLKIEIILFPVPGHMITIEPR